MGAIALTVFIAFIVFFTLHWMGLGYLAAFLVTLAIIGAYYLGRGVGGTVPANRRNRDWFGHWH